MLPLVAQVPDCDFPQKDDQSLKKVYQEAEWIVCQEICYLCRSQNCLDVNIKTRELYIWNMYIYLCTHIIYTYEIGLKGITSSDS